MAEDNEMAEDNKRYDMDHYLKINPEKVSVLEIIRLLLWSKKMEAKAFNSQQVDPSPTARVDLEHLLQNGLAAVSLSAQKILLHAENRWRSLGQKIEKGLKLLSSNGNIFMFLLNILRCRVNQNVPKRDTDAFVSFIGHLDSRVTLDKSIEPGNPRYNSALAAMASKLAYENKGFIKKTVEEHWRMEFIDMDINFYNEYQNERNTQGFMFHDPKVNKIFVAFRGTEPFNTDDWRTDVDISCFSNKEMGRIHGGFMKALGLVKEEGWPPELPQEVVRAKNYAYYSIRDKLRKMLEENEEAKFIVTGHSLGGALAVLFPAILALHDQKALLQRLEGVYTFGQPRVGDLKFTRFMEDRFKQYGIKYLRFVYCNDIIPRLPPADDPITFLYHHFGTCLYFDSCYRGQKLKEVDHKNYISMFGAITRFLNALMELLRTLYLPLLAGVEYREGLALLFFVRFPALLFPGMADHNPQDYVNATRLGSYQLFEEVENSQKSDTTKMKTS